ncbi:MAG: SGNH/GDSL hydrolase family protein [Proteobacteria bacterium]|nr:SGNH/GDSL hydrolase family protein [Pseudomonadota bacterium]MCP4921504.1 SGNH/GDSL hydrolase family protein [Pseudomonadota bacterium]
MRRWIGAGIVFIVAIAAVEVFGRVAYETPVPTRTFQSDAELGWVLPPSSTFDFAGVPVTTNALGWRGPLPGEGFRIAVIGDSSTFGHGVADDASFAALLDARLDASVLNLGVPGYTCAQAAASLDRVDRVDAVIVYAMHSDMFVVEGGDQMVWVEGGPATSGWGRIVQARALSSRIGQPRTSPEDYTACLSGIAARGPTLFAVPIATSDLELVTSERQPGADLEPWRDAMRAIAAETGSPLVELPRLVRRWGPESLLDTVHPSASGHAHIADELATAIESTDWLE